MKKIYSIIAFLLFGSMLVKAQNFNFSTTPTPSLITGGYTVQATVTSTLATATSYSWTVSTTAASCAATQTVQSSSLPSGTVCTFTFPCCTNYTISCVAYNGSTVIGSPVTKVSTCSTGSTNSLIEFGKRNVNLFPNPAHNSFNIESDIENAKVEISDLLGHGLSVPTERINANLIIVNTSLLAPGVYYVTISDDRVVSVRKVIVN